MISLFFGYFSLCYKFAMPNTGRWVVYKRTDGQFVFLSRPFKTKELAEQERIRLSAHPEHARGSVGVGFVRAS